MTRPVKGGRSPDANGRMRFCLMAAVGLDVEQVVDDVCRRGCEAETAKCNERGKQAGRRENMREQKRQEDEEIL